VSKEKLNKLLVKDPVSGGDLYVSELSSDDSGVAIRGKFAIPRYARLDAEQERFLETFLRCRGMLNQMERELGISYPTVRARLDSLLEALDLSPLKEKEEPRKDKSAEKRAKILDQLERGEITAAEAKEKIKGEAK
jgi:hypothetical protein